MSSIEQELTEEDEQTTWHTLKMLENRSHGKWVEGKCVKADDVGNGVTYKFETFHDHSVTMHFEVPASPKGSEIKQFLDGLGYSLSNAKMLDGDDFYINVETDEVRSKLPTKREKVKQLLSKPTFNFSAEADDGTKIWQMALGFSIFAILSIFVGHSSETASWAKGFSGAIWGMLLWSGIFYGLHQLLLFIL